MSLTIAATTALLGLSYQFVFILRPDDLEWRAIPVISLLQWILIGSSIGFFVPKVYEITGNLTVACILSFGTAIIGMTIGQLTLESMRSVMHKRGQRAYQRVIAERSEELKEV